MELPTNNLIHWDNDLEQLIKDECEISYSYYLLHNLSFIRYSKLNNYMLTLDNLIKINLLLYNNENKSVKLLLFLVQN